MADSYAYRVRTREGRVLEGKIEADGEAAVAARLRSQGLIPIHITREAKVSVNMELHLLPQRVKLKDLAVFSRQFATMIGSGLSLLRALNILAEQTENSKLAGTIKQVREDVEKGSSLSAALSKHPKVFSRLYVAMVRSGETGGQLDQVLNQLADNLEADYKLRQKVKSAMTYPAIVGVMSVVILSVMLIFIVPIFARMFEDLGGQLPAPTRLLLAVSGAAKLLVPLGVLVAAGLMFAYKKAHKANAGFRLAADSSKLRLPIFGQLFQKVALSRFTRTLALLLKAGVPILQALDIVTETSGNEVVGRSAQEVKESVRTGESIHAPLERHRIFPPMVTQMIAVGEDTGALDSMLTKIADFYDQEVETTTEQLTSLIEPLMVVFLGGMVGGMVIALYLPMFKIAEMIQ